MTVTMPTLMSVKSQIKPQQLSQRDLTVMGAGVGCNKSGHEMRNDCCQEIKRKISLQKLPSRRYKRHLFTHPLWYW